MAINKLAMARGASDRSSTADTLLLQQTPGWNWPRRRTSNDTEQFYSFVGVRELLEVRASPV
jgi:hypothetical protein